MLDLAEAEPYSIHLVTAIHRYLVQSLCSLWAISVCLSVFPAFIRSVCLSGAWTAGSVGYFHCVGAERMHVSWPCACKAFSQGGDEVKHHRAGTGVSIWKPLEHGVFSPPFSLACFSLKPSSTIPLFKCLLTCVCKWVEWCNDLFLFLYFQNHLFLVNKAMYWKGRG